MFTLQSKRDEEVVEEEEEEAEEEEVGFHQTELICPYESTLFNQLMVRSIDSLPSSSDFRL